MTTTQGAPAPHAGAAQDSIVERVRAALRGQKQPTVTVLSSLLAVQDALHYIPPEAVDETAAFCNSTANEVWSVASYYTNFRFTPPGKYVLDVCWGPTCHLMGAQKVLRAVQSKLGIDKEGDLPGGDVTLRYNTCLGACAQAPCIAVNHHVTGRVTPESAAATAGALAAEK
jgi:NADH-quinone oxidoreductase subunit E